MPPVRITYDPEGDILYIPFGQPIAATGYQLSDQLLLRVDPQAQQAVCLTMFNFAVHVHTTHEISLPEVSQSAVQALCDLSKAARSRAGLSILCEVTIDVSAPKDV